MKNQLPQLLQQGNIWRASSLPKHRTGIPTGYAPLDKALHGGGWPAGGLTELLYSTPGIGEMRLLSPTLRHLSQQQRWVMMISPPYLPYAPALLSQGIKLSRVAIIQAQNAKDKLWAIEQALSSGACSAVLAWCDGLISHKDMRKLQLAAQSNACWAVLFRPQGALKQHSPAALRIKLSPMEQHLRLDILKQRGGWSGQALCLKTDKLLDEALFLNTGNKNRENSGQQTATPTILQIR